jgi:hypothetical protein
MAEKAKRLRSRQPGAGTADAKIQNITAKARRVGEWSVRFGTAALYCGHDNDFVFFVELVQNAPVADAPA